MKLIEHESLKAELSNIESLLRNIPSSDIFGRMSFESRRQSIQDRLKNIESGWEKRAEVILYFGGGPVHGSSSIRADFTVNILDNFQEIVSIILASQQRDVCSSGRIPCTNESRLCIAGMPRGSFGFILTEESDTNTIIDTKLAKAINIAADLIKKSYSQEEEFEEKIADTPERAVTSLKKFIGTLFKFNATMHLKTDANKITLNKDQVVKSNTNIETTKIQKKEDVILIGIFKGVTGLSRNFNFIPDDETLHPYISGKVAITIEDAFLETMNREYMGKYCKGIFSITETNKIGEAKTRRRFVLTDIFPA